MYLVRHYLLPQVRLLLPAVLFAAASIVFTIYASSIVFTIYASTKLTEFHTDYYPPEQYPELAPKKDYCPCMAICCGPLCYGTEYLKR